MKNQGVQLLFNDETHSHGANFTKLLRHAKQLDCMVAFAKNSGLDLIIEPLTSSLKNGLAARFAISLDFYLTDPDLLRKLFKLGVKYELSLYVSRSEWTFHPKIYALSHGSGCAVMVGSANLTSGGLASNYEASALINDPSGTFAREVARYIDELIEQEELVEATKEGIDEYQRLHRLYHVIQKIKDTRFYRAKCRSGVNMEFLKAILQEMKSDSSGNGFQAQKITRHKHLTEAFSKIEALASTGKLNEEAFLERYEQLIEMFHSGGLQHGKNFIAQNADKFQAALAAILQSDRPTAADAYQLLLDHFRDIPGAGVNILTEILLTLDSKRFAVMNQNAVSGLGLASINDFPAKPSKSKVSAETYARYCQKATQVRDELGLSDFAELDALFNYAYWRHDEAEREDV
jgi:HKD family nuclease